MIGGDTARGGGLNGGGGVNGGGNRSSSNAFFSEWRMETLDRMCVGVGAAHVRVRARARRFFAGGAQRIFGGFKAAPGLPRTTPSEECVGF